MQGAFNEWMQLALLMVLTAAIIFYVTRWKRRGRQLPRGGP